MKAILILCLFALVSARAQAQQMPAFLNPDPNYWRNLYLNEQARANGLEQSGKTAINGLKDALRLANGKLASKDTTIAVLVAQRDANEVRALTAEIALKPTADKLASYEGRTWVGKKLRQVGTGLKYVGGVTLVILAIKVAL